jgi:hypothetical protein
MLKNLQLSSPLMALISHLSLSLLRCKRWGQSSHRRHSWSLHKLTSSSDLSSKSNVKSLHPYPVLQKFHVDSFFKIFITRERILHAKN